MVSIPKQNAIKVFPPTLKFVELNIKLYRYDAYKTAEFQAAINLSASFPD